MQNNIECEVRSFLTEKQYKDLLIRLKKSANFLGEDEQVNHYFDSKQDLRIQRNKIYSKIWLKKGAMHDEHREEIEIKINREDFEKAEQIFLALGYKVEIKWFRKRFSFKWADINVELDYTKGYGYILELEKMTSENKKEETIKHLKEKLQELGIPLTPKAEFDEKYAYYKQNWRQLTGEA